MSCGARWTRSARTSSTCTRRTIAIFGTLTPDVDAVIVISRDDRVSLTLALIVEGVRPGVRLIVTIYNRDLGMQVRRAVRNVRVMSMADIVAPALAGPCLDPQLIAVSRSSGGPHAVRDGSEGPAVRALVTVGPNPAIDHGPDWLKLFSAASMLAALAFTAVFTAGLINRLMHRRLVAIVGRRAMPRRDHVVVVGLGQVGLRLCLMLRELGIPVVAVERDEQADNIVRAKRYGVPVVIGGGGSRGVLSRLCLQRARSLAAVASDEIENISTAVAALSIREDLPTLLRAGSGDVMDETRALFSIGVVRDVYLIGGTLLAAAALGSPSEEAFPYRDTVFITRPDGAVEPFAAHVAALAGIS